MIHYQLRCSRDHQFDGWFRDSAAFATQAEAGLVECPECGDVVVNRALMTPSLGRKGAVRGAGKVVDELGQVQAAPAPAPASALAAVPDRVGAAIPDQVRAMLQKLRAEVETKCEHVGPRFAEERGRSIAGDSPARGIYGQATPEQAEALAEDGIEVSRIPWVPRADG